MKRTSNELKTWYDSLRNKLGKIKKAVTKSVQAADRFIATKRLIGKNFQFLWDHITQMPRMTVASFIARLQPDAAGSSPAAAASEATEMFHLLLVLQGTPHLLHLPSLYTHTSSTTGVYNQDLLVGLSETFLAEWHSQEHLVTAFGSSVDESL
ncbi:hypothetical protein ScPMuIL_018316 [Solemya velum]